MVHLIWMMGPLFILGDSYADGAGNFTYLQSGSPPQFVEQAEPTYGMDLALAAGQKDACNGRYVPPQYYFYPSRRRGKNYAISGSGWQFSTQPIGHPNCLADQITQLLTDYPNGLPDKSVVLISIGINDADYMVTLSGGQQVNSSWIINGNQTVPNATQTMTINVQSSAGAVPNSLIAIPSSSGYLWGAGITEVGDGTISFLQSNPGWNGATLTSGQAIITYGAWWSQNANLAPSASLIARLVSAGATVVLTSPPDISLLPANLSNASTYHNSWAVYCSQLAATYPTGVSFLDLAPFFNAVSANPISFGFKDMTSEWTLNQSMPYNEFFFYDGYHPTSPAHQAIFNNVVLPKFLQWGFFRLQ